MNLHL